MSRNRSGKTRNTGDKFEDIIYEYVQSDSDTLVLDGPTNDIVKIIGGLVASVLPCYLFMSPMYDLDIKDHLIFVSIVTITATALLSQSHANIAARKQAQLWKSRERTVREKFEIAHKRKGAKLPKAERKVQQEQFAIVMHELFEATGKEATAYALFINNAVFVALFCLTTNSLASSYFGSFLYGDDVEQVTQANLANYASSVVLPALLVYAGITQV